MIKKSITKVGLLRQNSLEMAKVQHGQSGRRRRGSLPSPPLNLEPFNSMKKDHHHGLCSLITEEETELINRDVIGEYDRSFDAADHPPPPLPKYDGDDFADEEEDEIVALFGENREGGENCDTNDQNDDDDDDEQDCSEENESWSPSPSNVEDGNKENESGDGVKTAKMHQPPVLEEENGKIKVTEQFMRDLLR